MAILEQSPTPPTSPAADAPAALLPATPQKMFRAAYAIGQGLISQQEYDTLHDKYFIPAKLSVSLAFAAVALAQALNYRQYPDIWSSFWFWLFVMALPAASVLLIGKFRKELHRMIDGKYQKLMADKADRDKRDAEAKAAADAKLVAAKTSKPAENSTAGSDETDSGVSS